jgi:hypothetical protein
MDRIANSATLDCPIVAMAQGGTGDEADTQPCGYGRPHGFDTVDFDTNAGFDANFTELLQYTLANARLRLPPDQRLAGQICY